MQIVQHFESATLEQGFQPEAREFDVLFRIVSRLQMAFEGGNVVAHGTMSVFFE
ncbi:MAG: hypothetical protein AB7I37_13280 [Pirellulales bacterium]